MLRSECRELTEHIRTYLSLTKLVLLIYGYTFKLLTKTIYFLLLNTFQASWTLRIYPPLFIFLEHLNITDFHPALVIDSLGLSTQKILIPYEFIVRSFATELIKTEGGY